ncbi:ABC transporter permease subunit [Actinoplanes sp. NPDC051851]|uniref:ABC transporter permease n=1 Tax=Actinoplanes sp. NPDC051851 TaxID=3154753 RepID=UPI00343D7453
MTTSRRGGNPVMLGFAGLAGLLVVIELLPRLGLVNPAYLPPTSKIAVALVDEAKTATFWQALGDTLTAWITGLTIAVVAGVVAGLVIGSVPVLRELTASTVEFLRPIPSVALIPLAVLLYGTEIGSSLLLICYAAFWQILVQVLYGVTDVDPVAEETARSYRFSTWGRVRHVLWPTALPYVFTGIRLAASVALVLAITAELVIGAPGLGKEIGVAQASPGAEAIMYALIVVTGLLGVIINLLARTGERRLLAWHQSIRGEVIV